MKLLSRDSWARFGFEGVLIVISILLAFSIESWWTERGLRAEEQQVLRQLKEEFEANAAQFERRRNQQSAIVLAAEWVLSVTGPARDDRPIDVETFNKNIYAATDWYTFDPSTEVLQSLVQSGKLSIITSVSLRNRLAAWPAMIDDIGEDEEMYRNFSLGPMTSYLAEHGSLRDIQFVGMRGTNIEAGAGPSRFTGDPEVLLSDPVFENLVHQKLWLTMWVINEYDTYRPVVSEILTLIEDEIDYDTLVIR